MSTSASASPTYGGLGMTELQQLLACLQVSFERPLDSNEQLVAGRLHVKLSLAAQRLSAAIEEYKKTSSSASAASSVEEVN